MYSRELAQTVARAVRVSSPQVVEDACAHAWAQFMEHQPDRDRNWKGWLFRAAQRESWRLERERRETLPATTTDFEPKLRSILDPRDRYEIRDDMEDVHAILERLPPRLQRIAMLRAHGLRHQEISEVTGDSPVRVAQLIAQANFKIYEVLRERTHDADEMAPRAKRLFELERDQPAWLKERIGRVPKGSRRSVAQTEVRRAWRRAALALDDYRTAIGPADFSGDINVAPTDPDLRRQHELARRAIAELTHVRGRGLGRGLGD